MNSISGGLKMSGEEGIYRPGGGDVPLAKPDASQILFHCYEQNMSEGETLEELRRLGAKDVDAKMVAAAYKEMSKTAEWINERFEPYFKNKSEK
jgi:hypothetical protein